MTENKSGKINEQAIGYIVGGGLKENLRVRLTVPPQEAQEGSFVIVESGDWIFYGLITDLHLGSTDPRFADEQSEARLPAEMAGLLHGQTLYTNPGSAACPDAGTRSRTGFTRLRNMAGGPSGRPAPAAGQDHPTPPCAGAPGRQRGYCRNFR